MKTVGIVGFGRFGKLWAEFLKDDYDIAVYDCGPEARQQAHQIGVAFEEPELLLTRDTVFYAVPISELSAVVEGHSHLLRGTQRPKLICDLLSVKVFPKKVFEKYLPAELPQLLLHPMFGPDSVKSNGFAGLTIMFDSGPLMTEPQGEVQAWGKYFERRGLLVQKMSAEEHDRLAAHSQGVTHFIGRMLGELEFSPTAIDTLGARKLYEIKEQICNDSWQLFCDIQTFNPFTLGMRVSLGQAHAKLYHQLLPNRLRNDTLVVGIQGGPGSFNEQAARHYLGRAGVTNYELRYLYRSEKVLRALSEGEVDRGQFAVHNSIGGMVHETVEAMSRYNFHIVEEYAIKIAHTLMMRADASFSEVDTIMSHPQALKQCGQHLSKKYSKLKLSSGEGEIIDHSKVAELLSKNEIPKNVATLGSKVLAEMYGLKIIEENLQDLEENFTSFLWVERPAGMSREVSRVEK